MKAIAITLLLGVFIAHDTKNWVADGTIYSPAAVFYMLQGAWSAVLSACLLIFMLTEKASPWRTLAIAATVISIVEGSMVSVCRFAITDISSVPRGVDLCDHVTGLPVGAVMLALEVIALAWIVGGFFRNGSEK